MEIYSEEGHRFPHLSCTTFLGDNTWVFIFAHLSLCPFRHININLCPKSLT